MKVLTSEDLLTIAQYAYDWNRESNPHDKTSEQWVAYECGLNMAYTGRGKPWSFKPLTGRVVECNAIRYHWTNDGWFKRVS